jgi:hypothetical protein
VANGGPDSAVGTTRRAIAALARAHELGALDRAAPNPAALAFTAMAQYQLHQLDEARDTLNALRKLVNEPPGSTEQAKTFLREAEQLIEPNRDELDRSGWQHQPVGLQRR